EEGTVPFIHLRPRVGARLHGFSAWETSRGYGYWSTMRQHLEHGSMPAHMPPDDSHILPSAAIPQTFTVVREDRERLAGHRGRAVWLTGLSGAGKSTLANALEVELQ